MYCVYILHIYIYNFHTDVKLLICQFVPTQNIILLTKFLLMYHLQ